MKGIRKQNLNKGQALVEYVLVVMLALGVAIVMQRSTAFGIQKIWFKLAADIAAPCIGCAVPAGME